MVGPLRLAVSTLDSREFWLLNPPRLQLDTTGPPARARPGEPAAHAAASGRAGEHPARGRGLPIIRPVEHAPLRTNLECRCTGLHAASPARRSAGETPSDRSLPGERRRSDGTAEPGLNVGESDQSGADSEARRDTQWQATPWRTRSIPTQTALGVTATVRGWARGRGPLSPEGRPGPFAFLAAGHHTVAVVTKSKYCVH